MNQANFAAHVIKIDEMTPRLWFDHGGQNQINKAVKLLLDLIAQSGAKPKIIPQRHEQELSK